MQRRAHDARSSPRATQSAARRRRKRPGARTRSLRRASELVRGPPAPIGRRCRPRRRPARRSRAPRCERIERCRSEPSPRLGVEAAPLLPVRRRRACCRLCLRARRRPVRRLRSPRPCSRCALPGQRAQQRVQRASTPGHVEPHAISDAFPRPLPRQRRDLPGRFTACPDGPPRARRSSRHASGAGSAASRRGGNSATHRGGVGSRHVQPAHRHDECARPRAVSPVRRCA